VTAAVALPTQFVDVSLTVQQDIEGAVVGFRRRKHAILNDLTPRHLNSSQWGGHAEGALAELAASLGLGLPWTGKDYLVGVGGQFEPPADVGRKVEVRWVPPPNPRYPREPMLNYDDRRDKDGSYYVLVQGWSPTFRLLGWVPGHECRTGERKVWPERVVWRFPASRLLPFPLPIDA
jgi:hypothetical protein